MGKRRLWAWDSNPGQKDGRQRRTRSYGSPQKSRKVGPQSIHNSFLGNESYVKITKNRTKRSEREAPNSWSTSTTKRFVKSLKIWMQRFSSSRSSPGIVCPTFVSNFKVFLPAWRLCKTPTVSTSVKWCHEDFVDVWKRLLRVQPHGHLRRANLSPKRSPFLKSLNGHLLSPIEPLKIGVQLFMLNRF